MSDVFAQLRKCFGSISRGGFTSNGYKNGEKRALHAGMSSGEASAYATTQFQTASKLFIEMSNAS